MTVNAISVARQRTDASNLTGSYSTRIGGVFILVTAFLVFLAALPLFFVIYPFLWIKKVWERS